jgi:bifunctional non-homologous end joining protein LigD
VALETYRKKRQFDVTPEPRGRKGPAGGHRYVIQKHAATRLHYDLRLELDGVMKSWAVTRGPSLDPGEKRLAVHVEDHPIDYNSFEGTIPQGEYGGGTVMIWDRGTWEPVGDPHKGYAKGHLEFALNGQKLHGRWHLVRMRKRDNERHDNWLLIKAEDDAAREPGAKDILEEQPDSVTTGRSIAEIAAGKGGKRVWRSRPATKADPPPALASSPARELKQKIAALRTRADPTPVKTTRAKAGTKIGAKAGTKASAKARAKASAKASAKTSAKASAKTGAPLPDFVPVALATLYDTAPSGEGWLHEIKYDGYRMEARLDHGEVRLLTRKQQDWTHRFKPVAAAVAALPAKTALIDGEIVVEDDNGISNFSLLQTDLKDGRSDRFVYYVFDLLYLDGRDLTGEPLTARKAALADLLQRDGAGRVIRSAGHFDEPGPLILKHACAMGLEGVVSKRRNAPYRSGRTDNFVKSKCHGRQEFVVAGFSRSTAASNAIGALIVAVHENGELTYAGRVGTGFTHKMASDLYKRLDALRVARAPVTLPADEKRKDIIWVKPELVIEAEFAGVTHGGVLRQASFKGVREDKAAKEIVREVPVAKTAPNDSPPRAGNNKAKPAAVQRAAVAAVAKTSQNNKADAKNAPGRLPLTHPDKVYWPDVGVTKRDLAEYYVSVWDWMKPHIVGRALVLVRGPEGVGGELFYQKHIAANVKSSPLRRAVAGKERDVIAVDTRDDLVAVVQSGALEIHVRGSRLDDLEICDRIVFDLDPGAGVAWRDVVAAARETRERLAALKLKSFVKLTGGKGLHVMVPIADTDWATVKTFTQRVVAAMVADSPQRYVGKMTKALRDEHIFIDYFRNSRDATAVAPYSTRARPGAPVAVPITWERLPRTTAGHDFAVLDLKKRIKDDAWAEVGEVRQKLPDFPVRPRR